LAPLGLIAGLVALTDLSPNVGREQSGIRPCVIVSSPDFSDIQRQLAVVVPCTTTFRNWLNHVELTGKTGLKSSSFAMTEQPRTVSTKRIIRIFGSIDDRSLAEVAGWVHRWIQPP